MRSSRLRANEMRAGPSISPGISVSRYGQSEMPSAEMRRPCSAMIHPVGCRHQSHTFEHLACSSRSLRRPACLQLSASASSTSSSSWASSISERRPARPVDARSTWSRPTNEGNPLRQDPHTSPEEERPTEIPRGPASNAVRRPVGESTRRCPREGSSGARTPCTSCACSSRVRTVRPYRSLRQLGHCSAPGSRSSNSCTSGSPDNLVELAPLLGPPPKSSCEVVSHWREPLRRQCGSALG